MRFLHLGSPAVQGSMRLSQPFDIHLEYVQRMMGWLLFADLEKINQLHVMQLGLGAAALTKFCHHHLGTQTTAIELNPSVIQACRESFNLPANSQQLQVITANAADVIWQDTWLGQIDVLQIDLYDQDAAKPVLNTDTFYRQCKELLTPHGCMVVNIFGHDCNQHDSVQTIKTAFGTSELWRFQPTTAGNTIVLAFKESRELNTQQLRDQAQVIQNRWRLPALQWLSVLTLLSRE